MDIKDLKQIGELMEVKLKNLKDEISEDFEVKMLNWKSEIVDSVDFLAKEIRDEREFREISSHQTADNTRRIEKVETKVFGAVQSVV